MFRLLLAPGGMLPRYLAGWVHRRQRLYHLGVWRVLEDERFLRDLFGDQAAVALGPDGKHATEYQENW